MFGVIKINQDAPNFSLDGILDQKIEKYELKNFNSKWLVIYFYSADFDTKSTKEILHLNKVYNEFKNKNCEVIAISTDSILSHTQFIKNLYQESKQKITFPLLSDKHHSACIDYNVFEDDTAQPFSSVFLINPEKKLKWIQVCNKSVEIDFDYILRIFEQSSK